MGVGGFDPEIDGVDLGTNLSWCTGERLEPHCLGTTEDEQPPLRLRELEEKGKLSSNGPNVEKRRSLPMPKDRGKEKQMLEFSC